MMAVPSLRLCARRDQHDGLALVADTDRLAHQSARASLGGIRLFRRGIPFFIGLVLGDYVISCLWTLLGLYLHIPTYRYFPV